MKIEKLPSLKGKNIFLKAIIKMIYRRCKRSGMNVSC
ncbi:hypothetical protein AB751O23_AZ_00020 [Chlamydiales bacterium SCGC AB-751-O23]|nr:hypothetical protein AB751O23_AZ_00020 [Chlamydiales bacterium SCGC AB-751-O23]